MSRKPDGAAPLWRGFRRARHALWGLLALLVVAGAALHELTASSLPARLIWLGGVVALLGVPLRYLLGFKCPRCGCVYLSTGAHSDFLAVGRILWAKHCGRCSLPAGAGLPSSAPVRAAARAPRASDMPASSRPSA